MKILKEQRPTSSVKKLAKVIVPDKWKEGASIVE